MPITATIEVNDAGLKDLLSRLSEKMRDLTPAMREVSEIMIEASMRAFAEKADPATGAPWKPLAPATNAYRRKHGRSPENILQFFGLLKSSIGQPGGRGILKIGPFEALVGTNVPYAHVHQLGAKIQRQARSITVRLRTNRAGKTVFARKTHRKNVRELATVSPAHTIEIPARPFFGVNEPDLEKMRQCILRFLTGQ